MTKPEDVLVGVAAAVHEVIGDEWAGDVGVTMSTTFAKDLELESIEFVALAEKLRGQYGDEVDFAGWLASMELDQILSLSVGQLVEFIVRCKSQASKA